MHIENILSKSSLKELACEVKSKYEDLSRWRVEKQREIDVGECTENEDLVCKACAEPRPHQGAVDVGHGDWESIQLAQRC